MARQIFRFFDFELDVAAYELRRNAARVRLERRPMDLLILMVTRHGELVTRAEIVSRLWGDDVFIEVETAVNTLVRKIRQALQDSADNPTFIETVAGKGYRFVAPVRVETVPTAAAPAAVATSHGASIEPRLPRRSVAVTGMMAVAVVLIGAWAWNARQPALTQMRVAVLPFESLAQDGARDYLADALHEETIAALGQIDPERIKVLTRRSTLSYRGTAKPLAQIAQELDVEYIVESSIHPEGERIRVMAKLIRAQDEQEIWSRTYDNEPRSMLDFQRALSVRMADEIRHTLSPERLNALARRHTTDSEAFQLYLQGLDAWNRLRPPQTTERAMAFYLQATQRDPGYALPWAGLALVFAGAPINADADPRQVGPQARRTAQRAIAADALLAEAHTAAGAVNFWFDWDWPAAEAMFRKATAADANYAFSRRMIGIVLAHQGRHDEAREHMRQLLRLEPTYEMNWALRAQVAFLAREYAEAIEFAEQANVFEPNFWIADYQAAMAYEQSGKDDLAMQTLEKHLSSPFVNSKLQSLRGYLLAKMGRTSEARQVLNTLDALSRTRYVPPYAQALVYAGLNDRGAALDWLEKAIEVRDVHLIALPMDAKWDPFRNDARFIALLDRCGFVKSTT